jgi:hypothetical protein
VESLRHGSFGKACLVLCILAIHCLVIPELPLLQCVDTGVRPLLTSSVLFSWQCATFFGVAECDDLKFDNKLEVPVMYSTAIPEPLLRYT